MSETNNLSNIVLFESVYDDVCEMILGYLPFKEKLRLEGVSKQWQRCINRYQKVLKLNHSQAPQEDEDALNNLLKPVEIGDYFCAGVQNSNWKQIKKLEFENVLKRCPYIRTVELRCFCDDNDLLLIGKYLVGLETLGINMHCIKDSGLLEFGLNYGHKLKKLRLYESKYCSDYIKQFLNYCPNLQKISTENQTLYISEDKTFLPKLERIFNRQNFISSHENIRIMTEKYGNSLKELDISITLFAVIPYINSFVNLKKLVLKLYYLENNLDANEPNIVECLNQLSKSCCQLNNFEFFWMCSELLPENMFQAFSKFYSIKTLNINIFGTQVIEFKSQFFKLCSNMKHLRLSYFNISDEFFRDIGQHLCNLQSIDIAIYEELRDQSLISLSALKKLKKLWIRKDSYANENFTDIGVCQLIKGCTDIEDVWFTARPKISNATIDCLIAIALQRNRKSIKFRCDLSATRNELQFVPQIDINRLNDLPNNLKIIILMA